MNDENFEYRERSVRMLVWELGLKIGSIFGRVWRLAIKMFCGTAYAV